MRKVLSAFAVILSAAALSASQAQTPEAIREAERVAQQVLDHCLGAHEYAVARIICIHREVEAVKSLEGVNDLALLLCTAANEDALPSVIWECVKPTLKKSE